MLDSGGNLMQNIGGGMALDMESGELHIMDSGSSFSNNLFDDEDD